MPLGKTGHGFRQAEITGILVKICFAGHPRFQLPSAVVSKDQSRAAIGGDGNRNRNDSLLVDVFQQIVKTE